MRSGPKAKLQPEERNLRVYGNGCLPVVGKFEATIECHGQTIAETILVTKAEGQCRLGTSAAKCLQELKVGPELASTAIVYSAYSLKALRTVFQRCSLEWASCLVTNLSCILITKLHQ